eukprot:2840960-Prorocentrum_lima.AAC.1
MATIAPEAHAPEVCHGQGNWLHGCHDPLSKELNTQAAHGPVLGGDCVLGLLRATSMDVFKCKLA